MAAMSAAIKKYAPAVIFLAYPNNPTGNLFAPGDVEEILRLAPGLVVLDEAYLPFAGASFMSRVADHDSLLVMRTLSKLGLAGLRLGYLVGPVAWLGEFDKLRLPYNINVLTQISAEFALSKSEVFEAQVEQILDQREQLYRELAALPGVRAFPSRANFILFELVSQDVRRVFDALKVKGVLIKSFHAQHGPLQHCLRVTVGTPDENRRFVIALSESLLDAA
jgi:histidinol-phosphate aminotransferase